MAGFWNSFRQKCGQWPASSPFVAPPPSDAQRLPPYDVVTPWDVVTLHSSVQLGTVQLPPSSIQRSRDNVPRGATAPSPPEGTIPGISHHRTRTCLSGTPSNASSRPRPSLTPGMEWKWGSECGRIEPPKVEGGPKHCAPEVLYLLGSFPPSHPPAGKSGENT